MLGKLVLIEMEIDKMQQQKLRPRRMRISPAMRAMVRETTLSAKDFVYPIFVVPGENIKEEMLKM